MPGITAIIITKNEERNIGRCLTSLQGVADEMIVLDSQSEDGTQEIARQLGAKVIKQEWLGYAATKNHGNSLATQPYILSLDADEALSEVLRNEILRVKSSLQGAYSFNRLNHYCGKPIRHTGWYPDRKVRLFHKNAAQWEGAFVHESLRLNQDVKVTFLKGDLLHYTYYSIEDHLKRVNRYSSLAAEKLIASGKKGLWWRAVLSPRVRFFRHYVLKGGFRDGYYGWVIASITAFETRLKYVKAINLKRGKSPPKD